MQKIVSHQNVEECADWLLIRMDPSCGAHWIAASISPELNRFILIRCAESIQVGESANFSHPCSHFFQVTLSVGGGKKNPLYPQFNTYFWARLWCKRGKWSKYETWSVHSGCTDWGLNRFRAFCSCEWSCSNFTLRCVSPHLPLLLPASSPLPSILCL